VADVFRRVVARATPTAPTAKAATTANVERKSRAAASMIRTAKMGKSALTENVESSLDVLRTLIAKMDKSAKTEGVKRETPDAV
jgi:hypothetical protein